MTERRHVFESFQTWADKVDHARETWGSLARTPPAPSKIES